MQVLRFEALEQTCDVSFVLGVCQCAFLFVFQGRDCTELFFLCLAWDVIALTRCILICHRVEVQPRSRHTIHAVKHILQVIKAHCHAPKSSPADAELQPV